MKVEERLKELGFEQNPDILDQWNNRKSDVSVYVINDKIVGIQISKYWGNIHKFHDWKDYKDYLTLVRYKLEEIDRML